MLQLVTPHSFLTCDVFQYRTKIVNVNTCRGHVQNASGVASVALRGFRRTYHVLVGTPLRRPKGFTIVWKVRTAMLRQ